MYLGVDIGSSSSKVVVLDGEGKTIGEAIINIGTGSKGPMMAVNDALAKANITMENIEKCVATGYGRMTFEYADKQITEISCHAKGVFSIIPNVQTIIDIGGQDAKIIKISKEGAVDNFVMNEKCAAGTGRFLEVMARVLDCNINELSALAERGVEGIVISNTCTVFAESETISQLSAGKKIEDIALGIHKSIAQRIAGLGNRIGITPVVVMTGGVALNGSVVSAIEAEIGSEISRLDNPQIMGALGAALYAMELSNKR